MKRDIIFIYIIILCKLKETSDFDIGALSFQIFHKLEYEMIFPKFKSSGHDVESFLSVEQNFTLDGLIKL